MSSSDELNLEELSPTEQSQYMRNRFPPGQSGSSTANQKDDIKKAVEEYIATLIAKNNNTFEDNGVHLILQHLDKDNASKLIEKDKKIKSKHRVDPCDTKF